MKVLASLLSLGLVGCIVQPVPSPTPSPQSTWSQQGPASSTAADQGGPSTAAATEAPGPCLPAQQLGAMLAETIGSHRSIEVSHCWPGRFPALGWAVTAWSHENEEEYQLHLHVLAQGDGQLLAELTESGPPSFPATVDVSKVQATDLNGDGVDEVLRYVSAGKSGVGEEFLEVFKLQNGELSKALSIQLGFDNSGYLETGIISCTASVAISRPDAHGLKLLIITGELKEGDPTQAEQNGCVLGQQSYRVP